jgi:CheY-like chemotaxis protein
MQQFSSAGGFVHERLRMGTSVPKRSRRIVVVDDERIVADTLAAILEQSGYEVTAVYSGEDALVQCTSSVPDLLISDVLMPGMNGVETAILVRKTLPGCKILLFSGQAHVTHLLEQAENAGYSFELLSKPIHPSELLARISAVLNGSQAQVPSD